MPTVQVLAPEVHVVVSCCSGRGAPRARAFLACSIMVALSPSPHQELPRKEGARRGRRQRSRRREAALQVTHDANIVAARVAGLNVGVFAAQVPVCSHVVALESDM
jgi:hypothetical protein